jgi:lambda repressor-like predicted transcriptional regulator
MQGKRLHRKPSNWRAAELLQALMADRGWTAATLERESAQTGHPLRAVSKRTVYRVLNDGYVPLPACQFEIAQAFGLLPSHIWGAMPLPDPYGYLNVGMQVAV